MTDYPIIMRWGFYPGPPPEWPSPGRALIPRTSVLVSDWGDRSDWPLRGSWSDDVSDGPGAVPVGLWSRALPAGMASVEVARLCATLEGMALPFSTLPVVSVGWNYTTTGVQLLVSCGPKWPSRENIVAPAWFDRSVMPSLDVTEVMTS